MGMVEVDEGRLGRLEGRLEEMVASIRDLRAEQLAIIRRLDRMSNEISRRSFSAQGVFSSRLERESNRPEYSEYLLPAIAVEPWYKDYKILASWAYGSSLLGTPYRIPRSHCLTETASLNPVLSS